MKLTNDGGGESPGGLQTLCETHEWGSPGGM